MSFQFLKLFLNMHEIEPIQILNKWQKKSEYQKRKPFSLLSQILNGKMKYGKA